MKLYIFHAIKDLGFEMEGIMHIEAKSKRKAKKLFKAQFKKWKITEVNKVNHA